MDYRKQLPHVKRAPSKSILRSSSASAVVSTMSTTTGRPQLHDQRHVRRRLFGTGDSDNNYDHGVIDNVNNNTPKMTTATQLVDELERLRNDNFQLRLRVYNAERRVERLSVTEATSDKNCRRRNDDGDMMNDSDTDMDSSRSSSSCSFTDDNEATVTADSRTVAAAKATAEAAVRTIHDLLTVNRRLLALLAATVSAKAVTVTADDKRRWRLLRNHIDSCTGGLLQVKDKNEAKRLDDDDDDNFDMTSTDSETNTTAKVLLQEISSENRKVAKKRLVSPPPPPPADSDEIGAAEDDRNAENELSHLRARCRHLEQSLQQLVNTELWARNRQIGKLEQHRYVTQPKAANTALLHEERRPASATVAHQTPSHAAKGILVVRSTETAAAASKEDKEKQEINEVKVAASAAAAATKVVTPPPVLPDYSEVNFFFSCDEEDEQEDSETNTSLSSSSSSSSSSVPATAAAAAGNETECSDDKEQLENKPVRLVQNARVPDNRGVRRPVAVVGGAAPSRFATSTPAAHPRKRQYSHRHTAAVNESSSSSSETMSLTGDLSAGITTGTSPTRRRQRTGNGCTGMHWRRRCKSRPRSKCSTCGRSGPVDGRDSPPVACTVALQTDAQVQCGDGGVENFMRVDCDNDDDDDQLQVLRRELNARRRENGCLYGMLLRQQSKSPSPEFDADTNSPPDRCGSPESYRLAARNVRGRIADLLPPLLSMRQPGPAAGHGDDNDIRPPERDDNNCVDRRHTSNAAAVAEQQQQQQLRLLARLRERIVAYERQELQLNGNQSTTVENSIYDMDRSDLVNVALPRAVDRLRRALVPLMEQQRAGSELEPAEETTGDDNDRNLQMER